MSGQETVTRHNKKRQTMKQVIVTTSWDDGHKLDMRLAALLEKYHIKATFYISPRDHEFAREDLLTDEQIKKIGESFEIGAHTMTHPRLTEVDDTRARKEMSDSKQYLEKLLGHPVTTFCYPGGNYRPQHADMAREAGFAYARTVKRHSFDLKGSMMEGITTVNAYNHYQDLGKIARFAGYNPVRTYRYFQWDVLAKAMFDKVMAEGGVFHLWGHSWEIDQHGDWEKLEDVLRYISGRAEATYVTNGELPGLQPKNLLIAAPYFPPHLGGVEFYALNMAKRLQEEYGWNVTVATTGKRGLRMSKTSYEGISVYRLPYWINVSNTPYNPFWAGMFKRIVKQEDIYLVNGQAPVPVFADMAAKVAARMRVPFVLTYHTLSMVKGQGGAADMLIRLYERTWLPQTLRTARMIICASDPIRDTFLRAYKAKSAVVTPGVDTKRFHPAASLPKNTLLYVGTVSSLDTHKGIAVLIEAMRTVVTAHPEVQLLLVGNGDASAYKAQAKAAGIDAHIHFLGGKYGDDLANHFRKASVFVLPTFNDSFGMVVLEAMASGLPVVSTPVGAIPMMVHEGKNGYLVQPGDQEALAEKLLSLLDNPSTAEAFGKRGRALSLHGFDWGVKATQTNELLTAVLHDIYRGAADV